MGYCPENVTLWTIWHDRAFSPCFIDTLSAVCLALFMLAFGSAELRMYRRHGTRLDAGLLHPVPLLYAVQVVANVLLLSLPFLKFGLSLWITSTVLGYAVLHNVLTVYAWTVALVLLVTERNFDLPTSPGARHSVLLNCFWALALFFDMLCFVNLNGKQWYFILHSYKDRSLLAVFVVDLTLSLLVFVLGMCAPGMASLERRSRLMYKLDEDSPSSSTKYGSVSTADESASSSLIRSGTSESFLKSVQQLRHQLNGGQLLTAFKVLKRKDDQKVIFVGKKRENAAKNRYQNVLPYDKNRVALDSRSQDDDYINASYVRLKIPKLGTLSYIFTQGPLETTVDDFWLMVFQQKVPTILMLTDLVESGVVKCFRYWPEGDQQGADACKYGELLVSCLSVQFGQKYTVREFSIIHVVSHVEHHVTQLQFKDWPDHGLPDKAQLVLNFLQASRDVVNNASSESLSSQKSLASPPVLVHCSAGAGRCGALVLLDALTHCIDVQARLRPVEITRALREQRANAVQTDDQFKFACQTSLLYFDAKRGR